METLIDIVRYLLEEKAANPNIQNKAGSTPLHKGAVAKYEQLQILRLLLEHKADPLIRNSNGLLPEQLAPGDLVCCLFIVICTACSPLARPRRYWWGRVCLLKSL
jgi:hypothetical protein